MYTGKLLSCLAFAAKSASHNNDQATNELTIGILWLGIVSTCGTKIDTYLLREGEFIQCTYRFEAKNESRDKRVYGGTLLAFGAHVLPSLPRHLMSYSSIPVY